MGPPPPGNFFADALAYSAAPINENSPFFLFSHDPWIFIHDTDIVEGGLMVLFFGLVFSVAPPRSGNFSADAHALAYNAAPINANSSFFTRLLVVTFLT